MTKTLADFKRDIAIGTHIQCIGIAEPRYGATELQLIELSLSIITVILIINVIIQSNIWIASI